MAFKWRMPSDDDTNLEKRSFIKSAPLLERRILELKCPPHINQWRTPARTSQSLSSAISPSGRYMYIAYLFGISILDTVTGKEE